MPPAKKQKVPGTSPGKTPKPMTHGGDSVDWENGKKNHKRIAGLRAHRTPLAGGRPPDPRVRP